MASAAAMAMAMAMVFCWALVDIQSALAADEKSQFLDAINQYRLALSLAALTPNSGAACVAQQVADSYSATPCSATTGTGTVPGEEPQLSEGMLGKCSLQLVNVKDGFLGPACVTQSTSGAKAPKVAAEGITMSQAYTVYLNDSKYVSAGVGSVDSRWFVLALATNASGGNYVNQDLDPSENRAGSTVTWPLLVSVLASLVAALIF